MTKKYMTFCKAYRRADNYKAIRSFSQGIGRPTDKAESYINTYNKGETAQQLINKHTHTNYIGR